MYLPTGQRVGHHNKKEVTWSELATGHHNRRRRGYMVRTSSYVATITRK
jgi:hypothetical protein